MDEFKLLILLLVNRDFGPRQLRGLGDLLSLAFRRARPPKYRWRWLAILLPSVLVTIMTGYGKILWRIDPLCIP